MVWCVNTLKIVGQGEVEKSSLCNFEFDMDSGFLEDFIVIDEDSRNLIKTIVFPSMLFKATFWGESTTSYTMHFLKIRGGMIWDIDDSDISLIAKEYNARTGNKIKLTQII